MNRSCMKADSLHCSCIMTQCKRQRSNLAGLRSEMIGVVDRSMRSVSEIEQAARAFEQAAINDKRDINKLKAKYSTDSRSTYSMQSPEREETRYSFDRTSGCRGSALASQSPGAVLVDCPPPPSTRHYHYLQPQQACVLQYVEALICHCPGLIGCEGAEGTWPASCVSILTTAHLIPG